MTMLAKIMPEEELLEKLQEAITEYKVTKSKEAKKGLEFYLMLTSTNIFTTEKSAIEVIDELEKSHDAIELLKDKTKITS